MPIAVTVFAGADDEPLSFIAFSRIDAGQRDRRPGLAGGRRSTIAVAICGCRLRVIS
jgi:hypothetical protein